MEKSVCGAVKKGNFLHFPPNFYMNPKLFQNIKFIQWKFKKSRGGEYTGPNLMKLSMANAGII